MPPTGQCARPKRFVTRGRISLQKRPCGNEKPHLTPPSPSTVSQPQTPHFHGKNTQFHPVYGLLFQRSSTSVPTYRRRTSTFILTFGARKVPSPKTWTYKPTTQARMGRSTRTCFSKNRERGNEKAGNKGTKKAGNKGTKKEGTRERKNREQGNEGTGNTE